MAFIKFQCFGATMAEALERASAMGDKMGYNDIIVNCCCECSNGRWMVIFTVSAK